MYLQRLYTIILSAMLGMSIQATELLKFRGSESATIGVYVEELATGRVIVASNEGRLMTPASVTKSVTTAASQLSLDPDFCFMTDVCLVGDTVSKNGIVSADLVVRASGDPTIDSEHFPQHSGFADSIVTYLSKLGVTQIKGRVIIDESLVKAMGTHPTWMIEDVAWDYGAGHRPFNYRDNKFMVKVQNDLGVLAISSNFYGVKVMSRLSVADNTDISLDRIGDSVLVVNGTISEKRHSCDVACAMPDTKKVFMDDLADRLGRNGISLEQTVYCSNRSIADTLVLYRHKSPCRDEILRSLMVRSDNMFADAMLCAISPNDSSPDSVISMFKKRGIESDAISLYDGCGLSRVDRLSPSYLADVYRYMAKSDISVDYVATFPRSGRDGTMKNFMKGTRLDGLLALKTGSMGGVQCFGGYKIDGDGKPTHIVVIMVNNYYCKNSELRNAIKRLLLRIF